MTLRFDTREEKLAHRLLNLGGYGHLACGRRLNGEENNPRTPHARPDPQRVAAASLRGVAWSHDRIAPTAARHRDQSAERRQAEWKRPKESGRRTQPRDGKERDDGFACGGAQEIVSTKAHEEALTSLSCRRRYNPARQAAGGPLFSPRHRAVARAASAATLPPIQHDFDLLQSFLSDAAHVPG